MIVGCILNGYECRLHNICNSQTMEIINIFPVPKNLFNLHFLFEYTEIWCNKSAVIFARISLADLH